MIHALFFVIFLQLFSFSVLAQKLVILHTNDHHGQFMSSPEGNFGLARQATMVNEVRQTAQQNGAKVLVLSAGDINTGAPESNLFRARPDIEAMNAIGYDAMVVGNHEFDIPYEALKDQQKMAKFEFLGANIKYENGKAAFTPYITREIDGKKVAIIGVTTLETPDMSAKVNRPGLVWENPLTAQRTLVKQLKQDHDYVIALSHMGYYANEVSGLPYPGDEALARAIPELDLIIGGHTHSEIHTPVKIGKTSIVQAKEGGQFLGKIEIDLSGSTPVITDYKLMPVKNVDADLKVASILDPYLASAQEKLSRKIGFSKIELKGGREAVNTADSPLGNLLAEAKRESVGADISFVHGRGIRASLPKGDVTLRDVLSVSPFGNTVTTAELNGEEVWKTMEILNRKYVSVPGENTYFSRGLTLEIENKQIKRIFLNGQEIPRTSSGSYRVATGNFLTEMVPEFEFIRKHPSYMNTGKTEVEAIENYFKKLSTIEPKKLIHGSIKSPGKGPCGQVLMNLLKAL
jgi:5'-nucleotidase / UDP-sugar diphosphatase